MEIISTIKVRLTEEEKKACEIVDRVLSQLWFALNDDDALISTETGEIIKIAKIPYWRGALSGLAQRYDWEVHSQYFN